MESAKDAVNPMIIVPVRKNRLHQIKEIIQIPAKKVNKSQL